MVQFRVTTPNKIYWYEFEVKTPIVLLYDVDTELYTTHSVGLGRLVYTFIETESWFCIH